MSFAPDVLCVQAMREIQVSAGSFSAPCIVLHGAADTMTSPTMSARFTLKSASTDKTYVRITGVKHVSPLLKSPAFAFYIVPFSSTGPVV